MIKTTNSFLVIAALIFIACGDKQTNNTKEKDRFRTLDTTIAFSGYWVNEEYYNSIRDFRSPKKAQGGSSMIVIPERTLIQTIHIYGFHEGGPFLKVVFNKNKYQVWEFDEDSLTNFHHDIKVIDAHKIMIGKEAFVKINPALKKDDHLILEEMLFKGRYRLTDGKNVEFKNTGKVNGLEPYSYYLPAIDYVDAGMQVDQVALGTSEDNVEWFGFKFNNDTLNIYKLACLTYDSADQRCVNVDFGELKYSLIKTE